MKWNGRHNRKTKSKSVANAQNQRGNRTNKLTDATQKKTKVEKVINKLKFLKDGDPYFAKLVNFVRNQPNVALFYAFAYHVATQ